MKYFLYILFVNLSIFSASIEADLLKNKNDDNNQQLIVADDNVTKKSLIRAEEAFKLNIIKTGDKELTIKWFIAEDYYLYKDKIALSSKDVKIAQTIYPEHTIKDDAFFGKVATYDRPFELKVIFADINTNNIALKINYQGCWNNGVCFPPQEKQYNISTKDLKLTNNITLEEENNLNNYQDNENQLFNNLFYFLLAALIAGIGLAFTPCVYPMIPILSSTILGQKASNKSTKAIKISTVYVISMATTYAFIGAIAGYLGYGSNINAYLQKPILIIPIFALLVFFGFAMLGYYEIRMPSKIQVKLEAISQNYKGGNFVSVIVMGSLSALIVSPCVAPFVATSIAYIIIEGSPIKGALGLFTMAIGMGLPLIIICGWGIKIMPKSGQWLEGVKSFFGVLILGVAIYLIERIAPDFISLILWWALFSFASIYLWMITPIKKINFLTIFIKLIALTIFLYSATLWAFIIKADYNYHPIHDFKRLISNNYEQQVSFINLNSNSHLELLLEKAANDDKIVILKFDADWCISCKIMDKNIFSNNDVVAKLENTTNIVADVTNNSAENKELLSRFNLVGPPAILFFKNKKEIKNKKIIGEVSKKDFLKTLNSIM